MNKPRDNTDIIGKHFTDLEVLYKDDTNPRKFVCRCSCGKLTSTTKQRLKNGRSKSCGCKKSEYLSKKFRTHGASTNGINCPTYQSYIAMIHRCTNKNRHCFEHYGGRGISIQDS